MNLSKEFHTARDYVRYYKSKFVSIVLPFVLAVCLLSPIDMYQTGIPVTFGSWLDYVYRTLWGFHTNENHLWFMYCMIGMLISAPFLSKLLHAMSDAEIRILLIVAVIWGNAKLYLVNILGRGVLFSCYDYILVEGYLLYFVLGYAVKRNVFPCRGVVLAVLGVLGMVATLAQHLLLEGYDYTSSLSFTVYVLAVFTLFVRGIRVTNSVAEGILRFLAKHTFMIYFIHMQVYRILIPRLAARAAVFGNWFVAVFTVYAVSLGLSVILEFLAVRPLQFLARKLLRQ